jgi:hypothetical protein
MNESLASLLMKNIDLILEAYNVDDKNNLVEVNKKKVAESDEIFHQYFVKSMNSMFRQINENDPILQQPAGMHDAMDLHGQHGMGMQHPGMEPGMEHPGMMQHPHGLGMGAEHGEPGMGDEHLGDMAMDDMHANVNPMHGGGFNPNRAMAPNPGMNRGYDPTAHMESTEGDDYNWVFEDNIDESIDSLFNLTEEDEEEKDEDEDEEMKESRLDEFMDEDPMSMADAPMDAQGGHNDFGGDMGGMGDDMGGDDMGGMDDGMGGDDEVTLHGQIQTDDGGTSDFEFSFDPEDLGFEKTDDGMGGDDMGDDMGDENGGGMDDMSGGGAPPDFGHMGNDPHEGMQEGKGKPGKGKRGPRTSPMAIVPRNPAAKSAAPFPTPQGTRQKKK